MSELYIYSDDDIQVITDENLDNIIETNQKLEINKLIKNEIKNEITSIEKKDNFKKPEQYKNINSVSYTTKHGS